MELVKKGRKWIVEGNGEGWIFNKKFSTKQKAEIALKVFKEEGRVSDYWKKTRGVAEKRPPWVPWRAIKILKRALEEIKSLDPECEEIEEFAKEYEEVYGVITTAKDEDYFGPCLHDTWGKKSGGRVHIDIGCCGYHLMLDIRTATDFIKFIRHKRENAAK